MLCTVYRRPSTEQVMAVIQDLNGDVDELKKSQLADAQLRPIIKPFKEGKLPPSNSAPVLRRAFVQDGLLHVCHKFWESSSTSAKTLLVTPRDIKDVVLRQLHDQAGYLGKHRTVELVKERLYWPGYESDIENWVSECQQCQQGNPPHPLPQAPLGIIKATCPFEKLSWDIMDPLLITSRGRKYILVVWTFGNSKAVTACTIDTWTIKFLNNSTKDFVLRNTCSMNWFPCVLCPQGLK